MDRLGQINEIDFEKINALDFQAQVAESVIDVFDTMLSLKLEKMEEDGSDVLEGVRNVGSVSFAGDVAGMFSIHVGQEFSREMAAEMLGMEVEEIEGDEEIRDLLGEISNIVGGNLKSAFTDAGLTCALSTPSYTTGSDFKIETLNMEKYERFAFRCEGNIVYAEMGVKISEFAQPMDQPADESRADELNSPTAADGPAEPREEKPAVVETEASPEKQDPVPAAEAPKSQPAPVQAAKTGPSMAGSGENGPLGGSEPPSPEDVDLSLLLDIPLEIKVELGRAKIPIYELRSLAPGSAVKLVKLEGEPVDILANDTLIARGEVVVQNEKYGIRVIEITSRLERIRSFGL
jgi:flagellar motor switch protein FliN